MLGWEILFGPRFSVSFNVLEISFSINELIVVRFEVSSRVGASGLLFSGFSSATNACSSHSSITMPWGESLLSSLAMIFGISSSLSVFPKRKKGMIKHEKKTSLRRILVTFIYGFGFSRFEWNRQPTRDIFCTGDTAVVFVDILQQSTSSPVNACLDRALTCSSSARPFCLRCFK